MRKAARYTGLERLSQQQLDTNQLQDVHQHIEIGSVDNRGRIATFRKRQVIPTDRIAPLRPPEEAVKDLFPQWFTDDFVRTILDLEEEQPAGRKRYIESDHPILDFVENRQEYLDELHYLESPPSQFVCTQCSADNKPSYYRCTECHDTSIRCINCIVAQHAANPFHFIEKWNGSFFIRAHLYNLGLQVHLGHQVGEKCRFPSAVFKNGFTILDTNGIHRIALTFCECQGAQESFIQLLQARLFPATAKDPHSAATFRLLHAFQLHSFLSKVSPYEYYSTLRRLTDNTGEDVSDRYKQFLHMVREWRHIKLLKRTGRGYVENGIVTTTPGQSAVLCPACPYPGINLAPNYNELGNSWLYRLFTAQDANFRIKRYNVSNSTVDPSLNQGSAYLVEMERYHKFLAGVGDNTNVKEETSDCNNHDAIRSASSRGGKGVETSGIAAVECARHGLKRPTSVTSLQKGERYVNMDYAFLSTMSRGAPIQVVASYDIACQWSKKLLVRLGEYSSWFAIDLVNQHSLTYLVPKWHLAAHRDSCRTSYSFNFTPGVGRTDGEAPERGWAAINEIAVSAKEMGPGSWSDSLDDYFGDYNWRKVITMHASLLTKLVDAVPERADHVIAFLDFSKALAKTRPDLVQKWTTRVQSWEADSTKRNPFVSTSPNTLTLSAVRLQLAEEDSANKGKDAVPLVHKDITQSQLLALGLEIEDQQRKLASDWKALGTHPTPLQRSKLTEQRNALMRKISSWVDVQHLYIPALAAIRQEDGNGTPLADTYNLRMPSSICTTVTVSPKMLEQEWQYRYAQAGSTLDSLRGRLLMRGKMLQSKQKWSRGQGANTRSTRLMKTLQEKIQLDIDKYNDIRSRLLSLSPVLEKPGTWKTIYQDLHFDDARGIDGSDDDYMEELKRMIEGKPPVEQGQQKKRKPPAEGRRTFSWIWKQPGVADVTVSSLGKSKAVNEILRIEWCKARARAHRWQEECQLILEEMRRVKEFFQHEAKRWDALALTAATQGHHAYAKRQAEIRHRLYIRCTENWARVDEYLDMGEGNPEDDNICVEYKHEPMEDDDTDSEEREELEEQSSDVSDDKSEDEVEQ